MLLEPDRGRPEQYLKLTGAAIDFDQFRELYGFRHANPSIRIPRTVVNEPKNADESSNKELIDQFRVLGPRRLEEEAAWIESYRQLWNARFDALDMAVEQLKRKEKVDGRRKRE